MAVAEAPTAPTTRISSLDVLRGIAILGTFGTNVWLFAHPGGPAGWVASLDDVPRGIAGTVEVGLQFLANGKFLALLTLLFGVGLELQYRSAVRRGRPWPGRYPVRAAVLLVEGFVHYLLVFEFDVLMGYAITSFLVAYLIGRSDRAVRAWMWCVGSLYAALILGITGLQLMAPDQPAVPRPIDVSATASWPSQVFTRIDRFLFFRAETILIVPSATVLFLLGSRLMRAGAFADDAAGSRIRRRLMVLGLGVAAPVNALAAFAGPDWFLVARYLLPPLVALGLLGLVTTLVLRLRGGFVRRSLANVGRAALSCYVMQNVLAGVLCYGWGLGLAGRLADARPWWVVGLWLVVALANAIAASLWLRRFNRGPVELLMHRLC
jgi:uncharacterized protein